MMAFKDLNQGDRIRLTDFGNTPTVFRRKLLALGLTTGSELTFIRMAPLGCPVQVSIRGVSIALRKKEIEQMHWERV